MNARNRQSLPLQKQPMTDSQQLLADALATLDATPQLQPYDVSNALEAIRDTAIKSGDKVDELRYELNAVYLTLNDEPGVWGTLYEPEISRIDQNGNRFDTPALESITPECVDYWSERMETSNHPMLRARYGDLVWDLGYKVTGKKLIGAARLAIDGYTETLTAYPMMSFDNWGKIEKRIVDLALSINDDARLRNAIAANVAYANAEVDADEREFRLRTLFAILKSIPIRRRPVAEIQTVVANFRTRLDTLNSEQADNITVEQYALPLAEHYWSTQQPEESKIVLRMYGAAVERMVSRTTMAAIGIGWLKKLHDLYARFEMNDEALQVLKHIEQLQPKVVNDLVTYSTSQHVSNEEIEEWLNSLITDDPDESFINVVAHFLPNIDDLRRQVKALKRDFPLTQLCKIIIVDHDGRAVAEIDGNDAEGKLVRQADQDIQIRTHFLETALARLFEKHAVDLENLFSRVAKSPIWREERHTILRRGLEAYFAGDPIAAIHILVTEVESAVRNVASGLGVGLQKKNRKGGFDLKNLGDFLADETIRAFFPEDVVMYLRVVLTDNRGWNLRNDTCHGVLPATSFTHFAAHRLLHIILLLSTVFVTVETGEKTVV